MVTPRLISEIDFKAASHFVLIERRIFVCSSVDFFFGGERETDMILPRPGRWAARNGSKRFNGLLVPWYWVRIRSGGGECCSEWEGKICPEGGHFF